MTIYPIPAIRYTAEDLMQWPLHRLLRYAVECARTESLLGTILYMGVYLSRRGDRCVACLAGCVLLQTSASPTREEVQPHSYSSIYGDKLSLVAHAINELLNGYTQEALMYLGRKNINCLKDYPIDQEDADHPELNDFAAHLEYADWLEQKGL